MRGAHCIDVQLLHDADVLTHALHADHITIVGVELMTVYTFYQYRLSVEQQLTTLNLNMTEAHALANHLHDLAALAGCDVQGVEIGGLSSPRHCLVKLSSLGDALSHQFA